MTNILFLTHIYPYPPNDGGRIVTYNTLRVLAENQHKIFLASFIDEKESEFTFNIENQTLIKKDYKNSLLKLFANLFETMPYTMKKYMDKEMSLKIKKILSNEKVDVVILDHLHMASYVHLIKQINPNIKVFLRQHNIESIIMKRAYEKESGIFKKIYLRLQYKKLFRYESKASSFMDHIFVITEEDKESLNEMDSNLTNVNVVKAGVDFYKYKPVEDIKYAGAKNLVFLGAMNWLPNENGVVWFIEKVFPILLEKYQDINFYIVGKNPSEKIKEIARKYPNNIKVTGYVEDDTKYIAMADVFVVPLLIGGGMRLKILNALAMKKAVVTTTIGAEGINLKDSYLVSDSPEDFAFSVEKLLLNEDTRLTLEEQGFQQVRKHYSFEAVLKPMLDLVKS